MTPQNINDILIPVLVPSVDGSGSARLMAFYVDHLDRLVPCDVLNVAEVQQMRRTATFRTVNRKLLN